MLSPLLLTVISCALYGSPFDFFIGGVTPSLVIGVRLKLKVSLPLGVASFTFFSAVTSTVPLAV